MAGSSWAVCASETGEVGSDMFGTVQGSNLESCEECRKSVPLKARAAE
jgi:hypothetical protein